MCQVSTHPPRVFATNLTVLGKRRLNSIEAFKYFENISSAPAIRLVDEMGHEVSDRSVAIACSSRFFVPSIISLLTGIIS